MGSPQLLWDWGTAYDLFVSLMVLQQPAEFGVRAAWAAGMRARLPTPARETLDQSQLLVQMPLHWIYSLPQPKDANMALWAMEQIPAEERLPTLALSPEEPCAVSELLKAIAGRRAWDETDLDKLRSAYSSLAEQEQTKELPATDKLATMLNWWSHPDEFGESYLEALRAYQEVFFAEEERRIRPALQQALARAQELAQQLALPDLLEELSQGIRFDALPDAEEWILAPSYWSAPLIIFGRVGTRQMMWLFGARPPEASLVPGQAVPDALLRVLKALSDPTRLRILHYLAQEPHSPAELARCLRLRAPTVTHHLQALRLAGLVRMTLSESEGIRRYAARIEAVSAAFESLLRFLELAEDKDGRRVSGKG